MTRGLGLVSLVVSLVVSLLLFSSQLSHGRSRPASPKQNPVVQQANSVVQQANSVAAETTAMQAEHELAAYQADEGTFVGATVTDVPGVTLVHAEPTTFCLQISSSGSVLYDAGPGGSPSATPC